MEAVPRLPMISFDLKISPDRQPTDFSKLKQYIRDFYHEDPESYSGEIHKLEALRATAMRPVSDVTGCATLKKYYCQLHFLQSRFPMGKDGAAAVNFTWRDTYANLVCTLADIRFEIVSVLYNIGALHSQLGATDSRSTSEGLKLACTHFQCAAWAFQHLKDTYPQPLGTDMAPDMMQFMYQVCLAQAQECILEKSMTDNRKATINAKVAAQIVDYYNMALNALSHRGEVDSSVLETVGSKLFKSWKRYVKFKLTYYCCIALLYQGQQSEEQQKMGERMAYYQAAFDKLVEATKLTKGLDQPEVIEEALTFTMDVVEGKRKAAKNENEFIYHEEVPEKDALPEIKGAALVKGIPFSVTDPDISGPDIFGRLVPMKAHEASSLYSEEKAKLLRKIGALIDDKDQDLVGFMSSLQLECVHANLEPDRLPQDIVDRCAALSAKPDAIQNLVTAMDKLSDVYHDVEAMLKEIMELIQDEEVEEREYQSVMGARNPSIVATDLTREAKKYEEAHNKAAESNRTLHKAMMQHVANLRMLQLPLSQLQTKIPSVAALHLEQQPIVKEMQHLVGKVDEMRRQRAMLATQLRESVCSDDITAQLVTRQNEDLPTLFEQELNKHSKYVTLIEQNISAQDNIMKALTETYAQYAPIRKATMEVIRQRSLTLSALISSYDAYEDLIAKTNKGQEFYKKLETNVTKLLQRVKGTCKVQQEERDTILAKNGKKLPSKKKLSDDEGVSPSIPSTGTGGPKLKDYLENYKREKSSGYASQNPAGNINDPYYNSGSVPSNLANYPSENMAGYDSSQQWIPSVRPAPVGQEGTCATTTSQDLKPEHTMYPSNYPQNSTTKPYTNDYSQPYPDQYASYMNQYQQYPTSSSPYHVPLNYGKNDTSAFSKVPSNPNAINYPSNTPSPQINPPAPSYPPSTPSPLGQNYPPPSYDASMAPAAGTQGYLPPAALPQPYNTTAYNAPAQYSKQNFQPSQTQNYATMGGPNFTPHENHPASLQQLNSQYPSGTPHNIPPSQNYPSSNASPQHNYPMPSSAPQGINYQTPTLQQSSYSSLHYQTPAVTYAATANVQPQHPTSVDQNISNNFSALQNNQVAVTTLSTYSTQNSLTYPTNVPSQEKQQVYSQCQNVPPSINSNYNYTTQSSGAQPPEPSQPQYSSYIPQMYTSYINNDQYNVANNYAGNQSWQSMYDLKNPQSYYNTANQYPNYSQIGSEQQYITNGTTSFYTHAGQQRPSSQTSASTPQGTQTQMSQPTYTQGNYYYLPYGCQYTSATQNTPINSPNPVQVTTQQGQITPQSPMTYMQASNANLKLTFSQEKSLASNVDLLAGLDFSLSQDPLEPQQKTSEASVKPTVSSDVEEKLAAVTLSDSATLPLNPPSASSTPPPTQISVTPKKILEKRPSEKFQLKDPFCDTEVLNQFVQEVEKFKNFVEGLTIKTLNGPTPLDLKWKELQDLQEKDSTKYSISVARCYPVKNRFPDILPYDNSRVELPSTKDDYINASFVKDITVDFPGFIVTQSPLPSTFGDFWTMVLEHQVELIVCLLSDSELEAATYWPKEKGVETPLGRVKVTLQSCNTCKHWVERIIYITDTRLSRVVVHLQFTDWPASWFPSSPGPFLSLVSETLSVRSQQRGSGPCVVHCLSGVGRSGLFLLAAAAICHIHTSHSLPDLVTLSQNLSCYRKNALRDREHLKFAYQALLYYSQDLLMKRGILASRSSFEDKRTKSHTRHPSEDFLLGPPKDSTQPQENSEKKTEGGESTVEGSTDPLSQLDPLWSMKRLN